jgi:hypothetical protein
MNRTPPPDVRAELRREVGFGCPVCGSPYLTWHHFDPPWREREHHDPAGMIALCRLHHDAADVGAYTREQLRELKGRGRDARGAVGARFEWMRHRLLAVIGGGFYYETPTPLLIGDKPVIWFNRDEHNRFLLNIAMPATVPEPRLQIRDNFWIEVGEPDDLECPPNGRVVSVRYRNGDRLRVEFFEVKDGEALSRRYTHADGVRHLLEEEEPNGLPVTAVDIQMRLFAPIIDFDAQKTRIGGNTMTGFMSVRNRVGVQFGG